MTTANIVLKTFGLAALSFSAAFAQSLVVQSGSRQFSLPASQGLVTFVPSNANVAASAATDVALSTAKSQVAANVLRAVPIPIVGPFMAPVMGIALKKFHSPKPTVGFSIAYVNGTSASSVLPANASFQIPQESLQGATPVLLRVKASPKDPTRIVRSLRVSVKVAGNALAAGGEKPQVLGVEQDVVACSQEIRSGAVVLTPESPLEGGEYAVALIPATPDTVAPVGMVWDFRVGAKTLAATSRASE